MATFSPFFTRMFSKFFFVTLVVSTFLFPSLLANYEAAEQALRILRKNNKFTLNPGADAVIQGILEKGNATEDDISRSFSRQKLTPIISYKILLAYAEEDDVFPFKDASMADPKYDAIGYAEAPNEDGDIIAGVILVQSLSAKINTQKLIKEIVNWRKNSGKTNSCILVPKLSQIVCGYVKNKKYNVKAELQSYYKRAIPIVLFIAQGVKSVDEVLQNWQKSSDVSNLLLDDTSNLELGFCVPEGTAEVHVILVNN